MFVVLVYCPLLFEVIEKPGGPSPLISAISMLVSHILQIPLFGDELALLSL